MDTDSPHEERPKPAALQLELPSAMPARVADAAPAPRESLPARARRRAWPLLAVAGLVGCAGVAAIVVLEVVLPRYVRRTCIERAAAHGIALTIDDVVMNGAGFVLRGVKASAKDLPGMSVEAPEIAVQTQDLEPRALSASGIEVAISGRWSSVTAALDRWRASAQGGQGGAWAPTSLVIDGSRLVWSGSIGDHAGVEADGAHLDVTWSGGEPTMHATSSKVSLSVPGGTLGPWRVDLDREPGSARARIALDPEVPDTNTILLVGNDHAILSADVAVPRSPIAHLGIAPALLGLGGSPRNLQVEAALHYVPFGAQATASATARGGLYGVALEGVPQPIDVSWDLRAAGSDGVLDVKAGRLAVGPLVGAARGTMKTYDDGFRVDLGWSAGPVPCAAFDAPLAPGQPFDLAYELRKLAQSTGFATVRGDVSATASLVFDSRDLAAATLAYVPKANCDVSVGR